MVTKWVVQRAAVLIGLSWALNGVVAFLTYTEEDETIEQGDAWSTADLLPEGWGPVLSLSRRPSG